MPTKQKTALEIRSLLDGVLNNIFIETRTVYTRADGSMYVTVMGSKKPVLLDKNGALFYEINYRTVGI